MTKDYVMQTVAENTALSETAKLKILEEAKPGTWYEGWQPYCMACSTFKRMEKQPYGFRCTCCGNMIGWNLYRLAESPLNKELNITTP